MEKTAFIIYLGAIIFGVLFFGAIHTWVYTIVFLLVITASLLLLKSSVVKEKGHWHLKWIKSDLSPLFFAFVIYLIFQLVPLPGWLLHLISPEAKMDSDMAQPAVLALNPEALKGSWHALAPYFYPVRMSLVRWIVYGLFFFGLTRCLNSPRRINQAIITILLLGCFETLYGIVQTYSGYHHIWWYNNTSETHAVNGTYLNRNHYAGFMEMGLALAIGYAAALGVRTEGQQPVRRRSSFRRRFLEIFSGDSQALQRFLIIFAGGIMGLGLILSASRGGIIAAAGLLLVTGLAFTFMKAERRRGLVILSLFGIALIYGLYTGLDYTVGRFDFFDRAMQDRGVMAQRTFVTFKDYLATGVGLGNFRHASGRYQDPIHKDAYIDYAHNDYAQFLAEAGLIGALLLLVGLGWYALRTFRLWKGQQDPYAVCLGLAPLGALVALAIHSWSDYNLHRPANMMLLIAIIAIGNAALHLDQNSVTRRRRINYPILAIPLRWEGAVWLICIAEIFLWTGAWTVRHFMAEAYCHTGINITMNLEANPSQERARKAITWDPGNAGYPFKAAQALMRERDQLMAPPKPDLEGWKRSHGPICAELEQAISLNPLNADYHVRLAWEYSYRWDQRDFVTKWLPSADLSMDRAAYMAGDWPQNPKLHYDMGNYWTMRAKTMEGEKAKSDAAWQKAVRHYRKGMEVEKIKELPKDVQGFIRNFFQDENHLKLLSSG